MLLGSALLSRAVPLPSSYSPELAPCPSAAPVALLGLGSGRSPPGCSLPGAELTPAAKCQKCGRI